MAITVPLFEKLRMGSIRQMARRFTYSSSLMPHAEDVQRFLQGRRGYANEPALSNKLFSFRVGGGRIWDYARDAEMRDEVIRRSKQQLVEAEYTVRTGEEVLNGL